MIAPSCVRLLEAGTKVTVKRALYATVAMTMPIVILVYTLVLKRSVDYEFFSVSNDTSPCALLMRARLYPWVLSIPWGRRHDEIGQATTLNLLLRNLLAQNLLDQAYKLASKTHFPDGCSNNQFCRYL